MNTDPLRIDNPSGDDSWQKLAKDLFGIDLSRQDEADDLDIDAFLPVSGKAAPSNPSEAAALTPEPSPVPEPEPVAITPEVAPVAEIGWNDDDDFGAGLGISSAPARPAAPVASTRPARTPETPARRTSEPRAAEPKPVSEPPKPISTVVTTAKAERSPVSERPKATRPVESKAAEPKAEPVQEVVSEAPPERDTFWDPLAEWNWEETSSPRESSGSRESGSRDRGGRRPEDRGGDRRPGRDRDSSRRGDRERQPSRDYAERQPAAAAPEVPAEPSPPPRRTREEDRGREQRPHERRERRDSRISEMSREARPVEAHDETITESSVHRPRAERAAESSGPGRTPTGRRPERSEEPRGESAARRERGPRRDRPERERPEPVRQESPRREPVVDDEFGSGVASFEEVDDLGTGTRPSRSPSDSDDRGPRRRRRRRRGPSERESVAPADFHDDDDIFAETPPEASRDIAEEPAGFDEEEPIVPTRGRGGRDRGPRRGEGRRSEGERRPLREAAPPVRESRFESDEFSAPSSSGWDESEEVEAVAVAEYQDLPTWEEAISYLLNPNYGATSAEPDLGPARSAHSRSVDRPQRPQPPRGRRRR